MKCCFLYGVPPYVHQAKVLKYPLNENFLSLQLVILRSQLIFLFLECLLFSEYVTYKNAILSVYFYKKKYVFYEL
ncbi:hypothetical protein FC700_25325 [Bacillus mycoides]|nr:hypothetical protein CQZ94_27305 [Bacillus sp. MYb209]TKI35417.1 hypothetical protein FC700_25325 [Bacillus mycoides]